MTPNPTLSAHGVCLGYGCLLLVATSRIVFCRNSVIKMEFPAIERALVRMRARLLSSSSSSSSLQPHPQEVGVASSSTDLNEDHLMIIKDGKKDKEKVPSLTDRNKLSSSFSSFSSSKFEEEERSSDDAKLKEIFDAFRLHVFRRKQIRANSSDHFKKKKTSSSLNEFGERVSLEAQRNCVARFGKERLAMLFFRWQLKRRFFALLFNYCFK